MNTETITKPEIDSGLWTIDPAHTTIGFVARHLMVTKVRGKFERYEAKVEVAEDLTDSNLEVTIEAASVDTGADERDQHVRSEDFLDVEKHPTLSFRSTEISRDGSQWKIVGDLTIKDVTKPVTLDVTYEGRATDPWGNDHIGFTAGTQINREDWGLTWNAALEGGGWLVSKEVTVEIEGQLVRS